MVEDIFKVEEAEVTLTKDGKVRKRRPKKEEVSTREGKRGRKQWRRPLLASVPRRHMDVSG